MRRGFASFLLFGLMACAPAKAQNPTNASNPVNTNTSSTAQTHLATPATSIADHWKIVAASSKLGFKAEQNGEAFTGVFKSFSANIVFSPADLANAHVEAVVDLASIDAGSSERNEALPGKDWFYIKKFPKAEFVSNALKKTGPDMYTARGMLKIKGIEEPLTLPFHLVIDGDKAVMDASFDLDRTRFHVGTGIWESEDWVAHKVVVSLHIVATK